MPAADDCVSLAGPRNTALLPGGGAAELYQQCQYTHTYHWRGCGGRRSHTRPLVAQDEPTDEKRGPVESAMTH